MMPMPMRTVHVEPPAELGTRDGLAYALFLPERRQRRAAS